MLDTRAAEPHALAIQQEGVQYVILDDYPDVLAYGESRGLLLMIGLTMVRSMTNQNPCSDDTCNDYPIPVPSILCSQRTDDARRYLNRYFNEDGEAKYSGRKFQTLRAQAVPESWVCTSDAPCESEDVCISAWDLLSLGLLAVGLNGSAIIELLEGPIHETIAEQLRDIRDHAKESTPSIEDVDLHDYLTERKPALRTVWDQRKQLSQVGPVRISKLMARKLPHLVPIYDSLVAQAFEDAGSTSNWNRDHWRMTATLFECSDFINQLKGLHDSGDIPDGTSLLRVMDVIVWMDQRAKNRKKRAAEAG